MKRLLVLLLVLVTACGGARPPVQLVPVEQHYEPTEVWQAADAVAVPAQEAADEWCQATEGAWCVEIVPPGTLPELPVVRRGELRNGQCGSFVPHIPATEDRAAQPAEIVVQPSERCCRGAQGADDCVRMLVLHELGHAGGILGEEMHLVEDVQGVMSPTQVGDRSLTDADVQLYWQHQEEGAE